MGEINVACCLMAVIVKFTARREKIPMRSCWFCASFCREWLLQTCIQWILLTRTLSHIEVELTMLVTGCRHFLS